MPRPKRIKSLNSEMTYHLISRTAGGHFYLSSPFVKRKFINLMNSLLLGFCFDLKAFSIMDNHFHILIKTKNVFNISDEDIFNRAKNANIYKNLILKKDIETLRKRLGDISEFMKMLKERFTKWYNKYFDRKGYLWGERFKSVIIEDGASFKYCKEYIEMNPVRAGIVKNPWDYEFSSAFENKKEMDEKEKSVLMIKNRQLEYGIIFGSFDFVKKIHNSFKKPFNLKRNETYLEYQIEGFGKFFSYKNLKNYLPNKTFKKTSLYENKKINKLKT